MKKVIFLLIAMACMSVTQAQTVSKIYAKAFNNEEVDISTTPVTYAGVSSIYSVAIKFGFDITTTQDLAAGTAITIYFVPFNTAEDITITLPSALNAGETYHYSYNMQYSCGNYASAVREVVSGREWQTTVTAGVKNPTTNNPVDVSATMRIVNTTSIADAEMENISIYPTTINNNMLNITGLENTMVSIYAINGQMVAEPQLMNGDVAIDMSNYVGGLYLVKLQNNEASKVVKVQLMK